MWVGRKLLMIFFVREKRKSLEIGNLILKKRNKSRISEFLFKFRLVKLKTFRNTFGNYVSSKCFSQQAHKCRMLQFWVVISMYMTKFNSHLKEFH